MAEHESEVSTFKVVDRRRFDEEGEVRDHASADAANEAAKQVRDSAFAQTETDAPKTEDETHGPLTFSVFIQSLAHQTLMAMGLVPWPESGLIEPKLEYAKETIDILTILQEKTKGNLSADEKRLLDTLLYELRMTFVQVLQKK